MKNALCLTLICCLLVSLPNIANACTTIIVGRGASADGSRIFGRTEDNHGLAVKKLEFMPAFSGEADIPFTDAYTGLTLSLPGTGVAYLCIPEAQALNPGRWEEAAVNAHGACLTATESIYGSEAALAADPLVKNGISESAIPTLVMPYVKTALEGVKRLGKLIAEYGSAEGNAVAFADEDAIWYMEIYSGHQWAAVRFPEDCYTVIGNDGLIGPIDVEDTENVIVSPDFLSLARDNNFLRMQDGLVDTTLTYCGPKRNYSQIRVWAGRSMFSPAQTGEYDVNTSYGFAMKPDKKIALEDVMDLLRWRYEGTPYDVNKNPGIRAIGINRTAETHVFWMRPAKPSILWVSLANPEMSVFLPLYWNTDPLPGTFTLDTADYDENSAYFKFRSVSAFAVNDRDGFGAEVRAHWKQMERQLIAGAEERDAAYLAAGSSAWTASELFAGIASQALQDADELFAKGLTAYMLSTLSDGGSDAPDSSYDAMMDTRK